LSAQVAERELITGLNLRPGMTVASIGTGEWLPFLRDAVGPLGKVIAKDGRDNDPKLAVASVDAVLLVDIYQHLDRPEQMLAHLRSAIKPGGRLYVVDLYKKSRPDPITLEREEAAKEIEASGFDVLGANPNLLTFGRP
jgi:predicted methyltransferase